VVDGVYVSRHEEYLKSALPGINNFRHSLMTSGLL
jgi:hypothetical protein